MTRYHSPRGLIMVWLVSLTMLAGGCVSMGAYETMKKEADQVKKELKEAQVLYAQEKLRVLTLEKRNQELKQQTDKWEANLRQTIDQLQGLAGSWGQVRDDLIRLNMDRELQLMKARDPSATGVIRLEPVRSEDPQEHAVQAAPHSSSTQELGPGNDELARALERFRNLLKQ